MTENEKPRENAEFNWIEVSKTVKRDVPPSMVKLEQLPEWIRRNGPEDIYSSVYRYSVDDPNIGSVLGGLCFDLDCKENVERARKEAVALIAELKSRFEIPESNLAVLFTGSKGFRVIVNRRTFDFEPSPYLPLVQKSMAQELTEALKLKTTDFRIYNRRALLRIENSKHPATGLYEIRSTFDEIRNLKMEDIRRLAIQPRALKMPVENRMSPKAREFYLKHKVLVEKTLVEKKEAFNAEEIAVLPNLPPCAAKRIAIGAEEGMRNISVFQLSVYWNKQGKSLEEVRNLASQFNERCKPPLDKNEVQSTVESAFTGVKEGRYSVGCGSEAFHEFCDKEHCPFFMKGDSVLISATPEMKAEAMKRLELLDLEEWTLKTYHQDGYIVGEDNNILSIHYLLLSGKQKDPKLKQIIVLKGDPAGGKTTLADQISRFFKRKKVGRFTEHALDYSDMSGREVLYLQEILGLGKEESGVSTLRFLSADDEGYLVEATTRDESGKFRTEQYRIPPITVITTTTHVSIEKQLGRRTWELNADQSPEQTVRILDSKAQRESKKYCELMGVEQPSKDKEILQCAINLLEPVQAIIPFPKTLKKLFERFKGVLRVRSDYDKFMTLVRMRAFWFQRQRRTVTAPSGEKIVFATAEDAVRALEIASQSLTQMLTEMEKRVIDAIPVIKELANKYVTLGKKEGGEEAYQGFRYKEFMKKTGLGERRAKEILDDLVEKGILAVNEPRGRTKIFELGVSPDELEEKLKVSRSWPERDTLRLELEKEQESFFSALSGHPSLEGTIPSLGKKGDYRSGVASRDDTSEQDFEHSGKKEPETSRSGLERDSLADLDLQKTSLKAAKIPLTKLDETPTASQPIHLCRNHVFQLGWYERKAQGKAEIRGLTKKEMESVRCAECGEAAEFEAAPA